MPLGACVMCPDEDPEHDLDDDGVAPPGGDRSFNRSFARSVVRFVCFYILV